ncbi:MAG: radical SAM protein, partial [Methanomicrobiales archaeon]|nr:radical SAM protein [Methanomicrobiales archaeon]
MHLVRITRRSGIPLIGCLYFGVIDRGTSLLQVRPSCSCNLSCPFCSVDAGPGSRTRMTSYEVDREYLAETVGSIAQFKGTGVEAHIDSPGEPMLYPDLVELVKDLRKIPEISVISMQSNGTLLGEEVITDLAA